MFRKSDTVLEVKPLPPEKAAGDDALAYFGLNAPEAPACAPGVGADDGRIQALKNELEKALTAPRIQPVEAEPVRKVRVAGLLKPPAPHNRRAGEDRLQVCLGQQALEARLCQACSHEQSQPRLLP